MSADDFQTKYASVMESMLKSAIAETTKLFENMVDELKAEISQIKKENEDLKSKCFQYEVAKSQPNEHAKESITHPVQSEDSGKCDSGVQCDLVPYRTVVVEQCQPLAESPQQNQEQQCTNDCTDYNWQEHNYVSNGGRNSKMAFVLVKQEEPYNDSDFLLSSLKQEEEETDLGQASTTSRTSFARVECEGQRIGKESSTEQIPTSQKNGATQMVLQLPCLGTNSSCQVAQNQPSDLNHSLVISLTDALREDIKEENGVCQMTAKMITLEDVTTQQEKLVPEELHQDKASLFNEQTEFTGKQHGDMICTNRQVAEFELVRKEVVCEKGNVADVDADPKPNLPSRRRKRHPHKSSSEKLISSLKVPRKVGIGAAGNTSSPPRTSASEVLETSPILSPPVKRNANTSVNEEKNKAGASSPKQSPLKSSQLFIEVEKKGTQVRVFRASSASETTNPPQSELPQAPSDQLKERQTSVSLQDAMLLIEAMNQSTPENTFSLTQATAQPQTHSAPLAGPTETLAKQQIPLVEIHHTTDNVDVSSKMTGTSLSNNTIFQNAEIPPKQLQCVPIFSNATLPVFSALSSTAATQTVIQSLPLPRIKVGPPTNVPRTIIILPRPSLSYTSHSAREVSKTQPSTVDTTSSQKNLRTPLSHAVELSCAKPSLSSIPPKTIKVTYKKLDPVSPIQSTTILANHQLLISASKRITIVPKSMLAVRRKVAEPDVPAQIPKPDALTGTPVLEALASTSVLEALTGTPVLEALASTPVIEAPANTIEPKSPPDTPEPEALAGTPEPEALASTPVIEVPAYTLEPESPADTPESKALVGTPEPKALAGTPEPEALAGTPEPEALAGTFVIQAPTNTPEPEALAGTSEPETLAGTPEPEALTSTPEPEALTSTPEPEALTGTPEPEALSSSPVIEAPANTLEPEALAGTPEPEALSGTPVIEAPANTLELEALAGTPEPEALAGTPEPEALAGTPEPEALAGTPEPEALAGTLVIEAPANTPEPESHVDTPELEALASTPEPEDLAGTPEPNYCLHTPEPEAFVYTPEPETCLDTPQPDASLDTCEPDNSVFSSTQLSFLSHKPSLIAAHETSFPEKNNTTDGRYYSSQSAAVFEKCCPSTDISSSTEKEVQTLVSSVLPSTTEQKFCAVVRLTRLPFSVSTKESLSVSALQAKGFFISEKKSKSVLSDKKIAQGSQPIARSITELSIEPTFHQLTADLGQDAFLSDSEEDKKEGLVLSTSISPDDASDPQLQFSSNESLDTNETKTSGPQKSSIVSRLRRHLKPLLKARRNAAEQVTDNQTERGAKNLKRPRLDSDSLDVKKTAKEPVSVKTLDVCHDVTSPNAVTCTTTRGLGHCKDDDSPIKIVCEKVFVSLKKFDSTSDSAAKLFKRPNSDKDDGCTTQKLKSSSMSPKRSSKAVVSPKNTANVKESSTSFEESGSPSCSTLVKVSPYIKLIKRESSSFRPKSCSLSKVDVISEKSISKTYSPLTKGHKKAKNFASTERAQTLTPEKKAKLFQEYQSTTKTVRSVKSTKTARGRRRNKIKSSNSEKLKTKNGVLKKCSAKIWYPPILPPNEMPSNEIIKGPRLKVEYRVPVIPLNPEPIVSPLQPLSFIGRHLLRNQCGECGRVFSSSSALEGHVSLHNLNRPFTCKLCAKYFPDAITFKRHDRVHRNGRIHVCKQCGKGFVYTFGLSKHVQMVHGRIKRFLCQVCKKGFFNKRDVDIHMRIHTGEKPFQCDICERRFTRKVELNVHLRWHNGEKRHWCSYCGKGFLDANNLKRHKYIHTGEKPCACPFCPKQFTQTGHLKKHIESMHKEHTNIGHPVQ